MSLRSRPARAMFRSWRPWPMWVAVSILAVGLSAPGAGSAFWDAPPPRGLHRPTAYVLPRGKVEVQFFAFASPTNPLEFFQFEFGLTDSVQVGMRPLSALFGDVQAWGKAQVGTSGPVSLAIPFGLQLLIPIPAWSLHGGWVLSWRVLPFLSLHPGISLVFYPALRMEPYAGVHLDVGRNVKLVLEGGVGPPHFSAGILVWAFDSVRLQIDTPLPTVHLRISVTGRF